ncbi:glutathione S-transferase-like [Cimex lectularius]|uniref:glutathione transferase n=1 Tax=Cimex lectularius TaxID=79782 RepID=A0A8I6SDI1_CIMLE|nr:glutathione S-transferase-like [Cimex lectularius]XP_024082014.1 glutathione S-transferase-like [Cimex lectularius]
MTSKLTYFDQTGLAEPIRLILSFGGVEFIDQRVSLDEWKELKLRLPWPQLPVLEMEDKVYYQSKAICRFLAKRFNLCGKTEWEATLADIMVDMIYDFRSKVASYDHIKDPDERERLYPIVSNDLVPSYLERFERHILSNGGYFVAGKVTWADIVFLAFSCDVALMLGKDLVVDYPKLKLLQKKVANLPGIKEWLVAQGYFFNNRSRNSSFSN